MSLALTAQLLAAEATSPTIGKEDLRKTVAHMGELARQLDGKLQETQKALAASNLALDSAMQQVAMARAQIVDLNGRIEAIKQWGIDQQARADRAEASLTRAKADLKATLDRYHRLKLVAALIVAAIAGALAFRFMAPVISFAGPAGIALLIGAPVGAFAAVWFLL